MPEMDKTRTYQPAMTSAGLAPAHRVTAIDAHGDRRDVWIAGESPLTLKVDGREVVTLMTLGTHPEELAIGFLRNQCLIEKIEDIQSVEVDWNLETVSIVTRHGQGMVDWAAKLAKRVLTSGCGQGTIFSCTIDKLYEFRFPKTSLRRSTIHAILKAVAAENQIYKQAGAVHGCALCKESEILFFIEDVGRHNAADTIAGRMWLDRIAGEDKIFYTTGRLTSEIVMKAANMRIPILLSRSGITKMGLELAEDLGITMIGRARGTQFLVYCGQDNIIFDNSLPEKP
jgi:FdhD protein